jgi:hypothetical protein
MLMALGGFLLIKPEILTGLIGLDPGMAQIVSGGIVFVGITDFLIARFIFGRAERK